MKIGGVIGLVGGVGGMINGAMSATSTAAEAASSGADVSGAAADASGAASSADAVNGMDLASDQATAAGSSGAATSLDATVSDAQRTLADDVHNVGDFGANSPDMLTKTGAAPDTPLSDMNPADMRLADGTQLPPPSSSSSLVQQAQTPNMDTALSDSNPTDMRLADGTQMTPGMSDMPPSGAGDYFHRFLGWVKNNKEVANGIMTLGGGLLKGMSEGQALEEKKREFNTLYGHANEVANYRPVSLYHSAQG
jgi:hypothetical protein